jgi:hypothetical protein
MLNFAGNKFHAQNNFSGVSELSTRFRRAANFVRNNVSIAIATPNTDVGKNSRNHMSRFGLHNIPP